MSRFLESAAARNLEDASARVLESGAVSTTPPLVQSLFRWRNDDGSETTATWKAAENIDVSLALDTNVRLRTSVLATGSTTPTPTLYYKKSTDSTWLLVPVGGAGPVVITPSSNITASGEPTTAQLTNPLAAVPIDVGCMTIGSNTAATGFYNSECYVATDDRTYVAVAGDVVTSVSVYGEGDVGDAGLAECAVYVISGGVPTTKVGSDVSVTMAAGVTGWHTASCSIALTAGVRYGCALRFQSSDMSWSFRYQTGSGTSMSANNNGTLPATWTHNSVDSNTVSFYMTVTPA